VIDKWQLNFVNKTISIPDLIKFEFNLTDIGIKEMNIDNTV
jgi:hypothetical protein